MSKIPNIHLSKNFTIPQIGLGLWKITDGGEFKTAFNAAVDAGYRHFDSAQVYKNEQFLGDAWVASGIKREDFFLTTKIAVENFGMKRAKASVIKSLEKLQTDYVDLLLLHFPVSVLRRKTWDVAVELHQEGKVRAIGVSNYTVRHLEEMKKYSNITPAVNQVELHVFLQQPELVEYCQEHGIVIEAYSPLAHGQVMDEPVIQQIAKKHQKSYAQIMLRWCIEKGFVILPKSITPARIKENIAIFDFKLDDDDMKELKKLDRGLRTCWNPTLVP
jgi:diketogulonate reductase-like aldo/keto reductase